jgi:UDP-N-acetyl-D-glucosamine dehydrogenase
VAELALEGRSWKSVELSDEELAAADLVVILTAHSSIDWDRVVAHAARVYDTRNATRNVREGREKIRKL